MAQEFGERNIDLNCEFVAPKSVPKTLAEISAIVDVSEKLRKLNCLLQELEEEEKKLYVIRHELPFALSSHREEIEKVRGEILSLKGKEKLPEIEADGDKGVEWSDDQTEKKRWMSSAGLWNYNSSPRKQSNPTKPGEGGVDEGLQLFVTKAGAMEAEEAAALKIDALPVHGLSLSPPSAVVDKSSKMNKQEQRKQRRCWSPELHQRFINALEKLGGAQAATPKQIREIMNVDGLTNDEVKSHLQKYRLHVRRVTVSPPSSTSTWPQPYHVSNSLVMKVGTGAHSGSPEGPLQLGLPVTRREVSVTVTGLNAAVEESEEEESVRGF